MTTKSSKEEPIIQVKHISKHYNIGMDRTYKTLSGSITDAVRSPVQTLKGIGKQHDSFWALKDINFEVERGEVLGIIGRNGAGKSTLLKILSRITSPTEGEIRLRGRVGSLLEVGTGFHPELTGRENVYFNGAILGMRKREIDDKFDEIVKFSGVEKFLDTPVKRYSSGMQVRLAFSVAANLDPEILIVDEVLAVGDAEFQKKCLGKMSEVAEGGRTVLFVSHNLAAVTRLCQRGICLDNGTIVYQGECKEVIERYLTESSHNLSSAVLPPKSINTMRLREIQILNDANEPSKQIDIGKPFRVQVKYDVNKNVKSAHVICFFNTIDGINVFGCGDADVSPERLGERRIGRYCGEFEVPAFLLGEGIYSITVSLSVPFGEIFDRHENIIGFEIIDLSSKRRDWQHRRRPGLLGIEIPWKY